MPNASIPDLDKTPVTSDETGKQPAFSGSGYSVGGMPYLTVPDIQTAVIPTASSQPNIIN